MPESAQRNHGTRGSVDRITAQLLQVAMKTPLALLNLSHQRMRTLVAVAGIGFAVVLIFMQLGFQGAVSKAATLLFDDLEFDLVLLAPQYVDVNKAGTFPMTRLYQARGVVDVESASPFYVGFNYWYNPQTRRRRNIMVLGLRPTDTVVRFPEVPALRAELQTDDTVLMDRESRPEFEPREPGAETEIGAHKVKIVGQFSLRTGFGADGIILTSDQNFVKLVPGRSLNRISLGLVKVRAGADVAAAARQLESILYPAVVVATRAEIEAHEKQHWEKNTSVGIIFGMGVVVSLIVGMIFVYQVISSDITNHFSEYATLKAMGYAERYLSSIVLQQALILAVLGYLPGLAVAQGLYELTSEYAKIPIDMNLGRAVLVLVLSIAMCSISGILSLRKVSLADPADLF